MQDGYAKYFPGKKPEMIMGDSIENNINQGGQLCDQQKKISQFDLFDKNKHRHQNEKYAHDQVGNGCGGGATKFVDLIISGN